VLIQLNSSSAQKIGVGARSPESAGLREALPPCVGYPWPVDLTGSGNGVRARAILALHQGCNHWVEQCPTPSVLLNRYTPRELVVEFKGTETGMTCAGRADGQLDQTQVGIGSSPANTHARGLCRILGGAC
jgi:hypothetical protein